MADWAAFLAAEGAFRSWCADTGVPREVAEKRAGGIEAAHNRGPMIGRRKVMADWAAFGRGASETAVPFKGKRR